MGQGQKQATVETTLEVRDEHEPGHYLCVAIHACDSECNMVMIVNPKPTKIFRTVDFGSKDDHKIEFLDGERAGRPRYPIIFLGCYPALRQGGSPGIPTFARL